MALHQIRGRTIAESLKERMDYTENDLKTEAKKFISTYGCDIETADEEFLLSQSQYHNGVRDVRRKEIIAYQIRQSFKPGEITPEKANEHEAEFLIYKAAEEVYKSVPKGQKLNLQELRDEYGRIFEEKKKDFTEYVEINKNIHEYLIAKRNLEMLYRQEQSKNEKEGRDKRTRNSRTESVL